MDIAYKISIPNPCHEDWNKMDPISEGRFCHACQKKVTDFTEYSEQEIIQFLRQHSETNTCGRFRNDQLQKTYVITVESLASFSYKQKLGLAILLAFGSLLFSFGQENTATIYRDSIPIEIRSISDSTFINIDSFCEKDFSEFLDTLHLISTSMGNFITEVNATIGFISPYEGKESVLFNSGEEDTFIIIGNDTNVVFHPNNSGALKSPSKGRRKRQFSTKKTQHDPSEKNKAENNVAILTALTEVPKRRRQQKK